MKVSPGYQFIGKFFLDEPAVLLIHVCAKPDYPPDQVINYYPHILTCRTKTTHVAPIYI